MKQMVNAFSEYARAPDMKVTGFSLNELVTEVVELYRSPEIRVQIRLDLDPHRGIIEADRGRVRQILNNLLSMRSRRWRDMCSGRWLDISTRLRRPQRRMGPRRRHSV